MNALADDIAHRDSRDDGRSDRDYGESGEDREDARGILALERVAEGPDSGGIKHDGTPDAEQPATGSESVGGFGGKIVGGTVGWIGKMAHGLGEVFLPDYRRFS
jgi:hypothetical protein